MYIKVHIGRYKYIYRGMYVGIRNYIDRIYINVRR